MAEDKRWFNKRQLREELEEERRKNEELLQRIEQLEKELKEARAFRAEEDLFLKPGTLAEEAMHISGIFAAADKAASAYVKAVHELQEKLERRAAETLGEGYSDAHWADPGEEPVHEEAHTGWAEEEQSEPAHEEHADSPEEEPMEEHGVSQEEAEEPLRARQGHHSRRRLPPAPEEHEEAPAEHGEDDYRYEEEEREEYAREEEEEADPEQEAEEEYPGEEDAPEEKKPRGLRAALRARRTANFVPDDEFENDGLTDSFFGGAQKKETERRGTRREASRYLPWDSIDDDEVMREWKASFDDEEEGL